jgi:mono/diheme cytochrome c family protein
MQSQADDNERVERGKHLYQQYCYGCHGLETMAGGVLPDLRFADEQTFNEWEAIVVGGGRADRGMRSFAAVMNNDDALAIRAYVIERAKRLQ